VSKTLFIYASDPSYCKATAVWSGFTETWSVSKKFGSGFSYMAVDQFNGGALLEEARALVAQFGQGVA
jgi:hypothetical protein